MKIDLKDRREIIYLYKNKNKTFKELGKQFEVHKLTIKRILQEEGVKLRIEKNCHKGEPSQEEKQEIIRLYTVEHRGAKYIGKLFNRSDFGISFLLKKWGVEILSRSVIMKKNREIYGPTKGFTGRKHTKKSKLKTSINGKKTWESGNRQPVIGKSRTINTIYGKVQGSYELCYLQKLLNENKQIPEVHPKGIKTPYGLYFPDFEYKDKFIEIKSSFTLDVAKGLQPTINGTYTNTQWKKYNWVNENVKPVKIIIISQEEKKKLFKQAIENKNLILDNIKIKGTKYFITN